MLFDLLCDCVVDEWCDGCCDFYVYVLDCLCMGLFVVVWEMVCDYCECCG